MSVRHGRRFYSQVKDTVELAFDKWSPRGGASGSPIVFLHGLFGSKSNNRTVSKILSRNLKKDIYCPDLRNHGDSPHKSPHTYVKMAEDVENFIAEKGLERPIMIGHSMGARVAMAVALRSPKLVSALIPVDNSPVSSPLSVDFRRYILAMQEIDRMGLHRQKQMQEIMDSAEPNLGIQQFLLSNFKRDDTGAYHCRIPLDILKKSLDNVGEFPFIPKDYCYKGPTLVIRGTKSTFVPDEALPLIGELFPRFVVRDIDAGHWVIAEKPMEFVDEVQRFLDDSD